MKIAVFGGSFDPIHIGHIRVIEEALKTLDIDLLVVVPAFLNPFKKSFTAPPNLRAKWIKKALMIYKKVKICPFEIENNRPTYMIETVYHLQKLYKPSKIYLIIGADNLKSLHKWYKYKNLKSKVEFVVAKRGREKIPLKYKILNVNVPISATALRKRIIRRFLPKIVADEIVRFYKQRSSKERGCKC
ncbi:nicotinate (nicotinamide) nucleotide adenylyltransferase [Nitrosophilus labii]|uniref:nicotinate (nicotinamide) nucleotide adenylyltransferase n=1 Tax=Nitrosophilus labii TaxID=2706014 RepID=UPI001656B241|nr:nicotinate (nicotinamide) nucleotide adenylyltransferase [Nitrosophilus labii]